MFSIWRIVLAIGNAFDATRDNGLDTPLSTRQRTRTRTRTSSTLKGTAICGRHLFHVTITSAPHVHDVLAAATCVRNLSAPVFVLKHTTIDHEGSPSSQLQPELPSALSNAQDIPLPRKAAAFGRVHEAVEAQHLTPRSCKALGYTEEQVWRDGYDANAEIPQKHTEIPECTAINIDLETMQLLEALYSEPGAVVWEPDVPGTPYIALTPADETWDEFVDRCSNLPIPQWVGPYLHVPLVVPAFSPYGPTEPACDGKEMPVPVFSPSRFAESVCITLEQAPYQALFSQRHAYKAVAYVAAQAGASIRAFYDDLSVLGRLNALGEYVWSDPAAPLLEMWRKCIMVAIFESENAFAAPHIVVSAALPNAEWDVDPSVLPDQDESLLCVGVWSYISDLLQEQEEEADADEWWQNEEGPEVEVQYCPAGLFSESEDESEEARTPSPPSWPMHPFPSSTVRNSTRLEDVSEEEGEIPSVTEALVRKPWLQDEDEECKELSSFAPSAPTRSPRFNYNSTLSPIGEATFEAAYRPLTAGYKSLWTSEPASASACANDARSELGVDSDTHSMVSVYTDALEEQPSDADQSEDEFRRYRRAQALPRPSCDIFLNAEDSDASSIASPPPPRSRALPFAVPPEPRALPPGKANIPAGKTDWFDLPEDDLGDLDWAVPSTGGDDT